jgi:hypothetical protein
MLKMLAETDTRSTTSRSVAMPLARQAAARSRRKSRTSATTFVIAGLGLHRPRLGIGKRIGRDIDHAHEERSRKVERQC